MIDENLIKRIIKVIEGERHVHYTRTCEIADQCFMLSTGVGMNDHLRQLVQRQDDDMFKQRVLHTTHVTSSIWKTLSSPAYKVPSGNSIKKEIFLKTKPRLWN